MTHLQKNDLEVFTINMNEFKEAMKNEAMMREYIAFIEEKKP